MLLAMAKTVNVAEFKDQVSKFLAIVEQGNELIVCRRNVPVARVEPIRQPSAKRVRGCVVGCMQGTVTILGDVTEPCLPEGDWDMLK